MRSPLAADMDLLLRLPLDQPVGKGDKLDIHADVSVAVLLRD